MVHPSQVRNLNILPAVKITGAPSDSPTDDTQQQQLPIPMFNSFVAVEEGKEAVSSVSSETPYEGSVKVVPMHKALDQGEVLDRVDACGRGSDSELSDEAEALLDLLVDTLDTEFDPDMLL